MKYATRLTNKQTNKKFITKYVDFGRQVVKNNPQTKLFFKVSCLAFPKSMNYFIELDLKWEGIFFFFTF